jgi:hypothetical protein
MRTRPATFIAISMVTSVVLHVRAAATSEELKELGVSLTPWGAVKAGNKEGTIPPYTGRIQVPSGYNPNQPGVRPDPFANEKPLFSITASNMAQYEDKLSPGVKAMLQKYPTFRLDVYPSHRTFAYPKWLTENTVKNATACKSVNNNLTLEGCYSGIPFPLPKTGSEVMWNHVVKYNAPEGWKARFQSWTVDTSGTPTLQGEQTGVTESQWYDAALTGPVPVGADFFRYRHDTTAPARKAGESLLILESTKMGAGGTRIWQYLPGQRRVKMSPDLSYDTPQPQSGGAQTMDDVRAFAGALDRFDFKLIGKREIFIPYNAFKTAAGGGCSTKQLLTPKHYNPDCVRWELHRVWEVDSTPKPGARHLYSRRVMYFDEDVPAAGISDSYDSAGAIYRVNMTYPYPMYEGEGMISENFATFDLASGAYAASGITIDTAGCFMTSRTPATYFTPDAMAAAGVR